MSCVNHEDRFRQEWERLLLELQVKDRHGVIIEELVRCYTTPTRASRGLEHIVDGLTKIDEHIKDNPMPLAPAVKMAWVFHDLYQQDDRIGVRNPEKKSAERASFLLSGVLGLSDRECEMISQMIVDMQCSNPIGLLLVPGGFSSENADSGCDVR
jgi:predicted metal-dependent HD superfamily phosphohydrolase